MSTPSSSETIKLLQNALDCASLSDYHSGYTAREIHRKCLVQIVSMDEEIQRLKGMLENCQESKTFYLGWGKGKDE